MPGQGATSRDRHRSVAPSKSTPPFLLPFQLPTVFLLALKKNIQPLKRLLPILAFMFLYSPMACAQLEGSSESNPPLGISFSFEQMAHLQDYYLKMGLGLEDPTYHWSAHMGFAFRPFYKKVVLKKGDFQYHQFLEKRFFLSLDLEKRFYFIKFDWSRLGPYAALQGGLVFADYTGTREGPPAFWTVSPQIGAAWHLKNVLLLKAGYQYFNDGLDDVRDFRFNLGLNLHLGNL